MRNKVQEITIYSKVGCSHCEEVINLLETLNLDYEVLIYQEDFEKEEFQEIFDSTLDYNGNLVSETKKKARPNGKGFPRIVVETLSGELYFNKKDFINYLEENQ